jgi:hypothetical protein
MSTQPLTPAEQAAARAIGGEFECTWHVGCDEECHADRARAVVAAVEPLIAKQLVESAETVYQFVQSHPMTSAEAKAIFADLAALSRPTSEEH